MAGYQEIKMDKSLYQREGGFFRALEELDPSDGYRDTELEGLTAFERQLKRFDIKVSGSRSDRVEKFFRTGDSAVLFPAYIGAAVEQGMQGRDILSRIIAARTDINAMDYRSILPLPDPADRELADVAEGGFLPETEIRLKENLVRLKKRGRILKASYEAIKFQRLDLFSVALRQIGAQLARTAVKDAVEVLIGGDGNQNPAQQLETAAAGTVSYQDLCKLWGMFDEYEMNVLLVSPEVGNQILALPELRTAGDGNRFGDPSSFVTPFGAELIKCSAVPAGTIVALDRGCALEMVTAGGVSVEYDKAIDCQTERVGITSITGFAKLYPDAVKVMTLKA
ncbi:MAG: phage major capsid protein [Clostridiales bacterium]|nr:phage major capsid protein [Clostridiales bacterium]